MIERIEGKTPKGGVAIVAKYTDDAGLETEKAKATRVVLSEVDALGMTIASTILTKKT